MNDTFVHFKFHYSLSRKIPFTELSKDAKDVEFINEGTRAKVTGFNIIIKKSMQVDDAEKESQEYAYVLSDLISIKSQKYHNQMYPTPEATDENGNIRIVG